MAVVFYDGFDKYGPPDAVGFNMPARNYMLGQWSAVFGGGVNYDIMAGLSSVGYALKVATSNFGPCLSKNIPSVGRSIGGVRFQSNLNDGNSAVVQYNTATVNMCSICTNASGQLVLKTGNRSGSIIASSALTVGVFTTHYLEWDITFGASGAYNIYLDGVLALTGTGNTGNGQTSATSFGMADINNTTFIFDDLYVFDSTGSRNNAVMRTNPVVDTEYATSDSSVTWSFGAAALGYPFNEFSTGLNPGANTLSLWPVTPAANCTLNSVSHWVNNTANNKWKAVLYSDSSGAPNTLIATGAEVVGFTAGTVSTSAFASGQSLTGGTQYWIGLITDSNVLTLVGANNSALGRTKANTYTSGPPASAGSMTTGQPTCMIWGNLTTWSGTNKDIVNSNPPASPTGSNLQFLQSSTVGQEDLYGFAALQTTPTGIACTSVKAFMELFDAGARTVDLRLKSGGVDSAGSAPGQTPAQSFQWVDSYFETDPNGSISWTPTNLNAATSGVKVAS